MTALTLVLLSFAYFAAAADSSALSKRSVYLPPGPPVVVARFFRAMSRKVHPRVCGVTAAPRLRRPDDGRPTHS